MRLLNALERLAWIVAAIGTIPLMLVWLVAAFPIACVAFVCAGIGIEQALDWMLVNYPIFIWLDSINKETGERNK